MGSATHSVSLDSRKPLVVLDKWSLSAVAVHIQAERLLFLKDSSEAEQ